MKESWIEPDFFRFPRAALFVVVARWCDRLDHGSSGGSLAEVEEATSPCAKAELKLDVLVKLHQLVHSRMEKNMKILYIGLNRMVSRHTIRLDVELIHLLQ